MRMFFAAGLALGCIGFVSCGLAFQIKSGSELQDVKDFSSIEDDGNGKFNVVCNDGRGEQSVTDEAIKRGDVCKPVPTPTPLPVVGQVNPKAFNAFKIWRDGKGTPMLDYPAGYDVWDGNIDPDGVFYVAEETFWQNSTFIGSVTEGAKVEGDLLIYPTKEGRTLALRFSASAENDMNHADAAQFCKAKGLRLPQIQELLDFCAAGNVKDSDGRYTNNRCNENYWWSVSVNSNNRNYAWHFYGPDGFVEYAKAMGRKPPLGVRCVGGE